MQNPLSAAAASLLFAGIMIITGCSGGSSGNPSESLTQDPDGNVPAIIDTDSVLPGGNDFDSDSENQIDSEIEDVVIVSQTPTDTINDDPAPVVPAPVDPAPAESNPTDSDLTASQPPESANTRVSFDITVPAYQSDELSVSVEWGPRIVYASWVIDEKWFLVDDFPTQTEHELVVTFQDRNGGITLGSYETIFETGTSESQLYTLTANDFDSELWDDNSDGTSNLDELLAGINPEEAEASATPSESSVSGGFNFIEVADDLIHTTAGCQINRLATVVADLGYIIEKTSTITWPDTDWYQVQIVPNRGTVTQVFATVCEGGSECKLLPGRHAVINHTSGERSFLEVPSIDPQDNPNATQLPDTTYTSTDPEYAAAITNLTRFQHQCENGGSFI